jgi:hypothetical protein
MLAEAFVFSSFGHCFGFGFGFGFGLGLGH